ncbi:histidine phosphatase family protein [Planomicrobium okeanokoites]|uniref:histidine phosphatase family protein n=1 Tax=Planomicrobium okeanokoites TaxID=244 RepID=UPI0024934A7B|nr:histidine phosphatase family protein [Planomicrobium okeanokoites]
MDTPFVLHLIRHAPTAGNLEKKYIGWTDEAVLPFETEAQLKSGEIWGSDLLRCRQTASILFPNAAYRADPDFRECNFGEWEMKTYEELKSEPLYRKWIDDPYSVKPPDGESLHQVELRISQALSKLPAGNEFTIIMHGGPIRYLLARAKKETFREQQAFHGDCHSISWQSRQAFEEERICKSYSVVPLTAKGNM